MSLGTQRASQKHKSRALLEGMNRETLGLEEVASVNKKKKKPCPGS